MAAPILPQSGIYVIRNTVNNKVYVGSAVNLKNRWSVHKHGLTRGTHHGVKLQRAWNKYGAHVFAFEVVEYVSDKICLLTKEQEWINLFNAAIDGYNTAPVAGSTLGKKHCADARIKMSISHKKRLSDPVNMGKRRDQLKEIFSTQEMRAKQSKKARLAWENPDFRKAVIERVKKQTSDPKWKEERSKTSKALWADPIKREQMCLAMKGRPSPKRIPIILFGMRHESITSAAAYHGRNRDWVKLRMKIA